MLSNAVLCLPVSLRLTRPVCPRNIVLPLRIRSINLNRQLSNSAFKLGQSPSEALVNLSAEQQRVLDLALKGENVAILGPAGTGKSFILKRIIEKLQARNQSVAITASTCLSASDIGGTTLHTHAHAVTDRQLTRLLGNTWHKTEYAEKWRKTKTLVIDDISIIDGDYFSALEWTVRSIRKKKARHPFGRLQVIVSGDFFQLPPEPITNVTPKFAFEVPEWENTFQRNQVELTQPFRQSESELVTLLNEARLGKLSSASTDLMRSLERPLKFNDGIEPVELFPLQVHATTLNSKRMQDLPGEPEVLEASSRDDIRGANENMIYRAVDKRHAQAMLDELAPERLKLKVGAQVVCTQDIIPGRVMNGSLDIITAFLTVQQASKLKPRIQLPPQPPSGSSLRWPIVRFESGMETLVPRTEFRLCESTGGGIRMSRRQIPLALGWAMSIDKIQTRSLSRVKLDLAGKFAPGQAYVALSRARTLDGLQVLNHVPGAIASNEKYKFIQHGEVITLLNVNRVAAWHG